MEYNLKAVKGKTTHYQSTDALVGKGVPAEAAFDVLMGFAQACIKDGFEVTIYSDEAANEKPIYAGYTHKELGEAFTSVQSEKGWKFPINTIIDIDQKLGYIEHAKVIRAAIGFYAGGGAEIKLLDNQTQLEVTAPGYYELIGA